jgi:hypothetical protein
MGRNGRGRAGTHVVPADGPVARTVRDRPPQARLTRRLPNAARAGSLGVRARCRWRRASRLALRRARLAHARAPAPATDRSPDSNWRLAVASRRCPMDRCAFASCERPGVRTGWIAGSDCGSGVRAPGSSETISPATMPSLMTWRARGDVGAGEGGFLRACQRVRMRERAREPACSSIGDRSVGTFRR